MPSQHEHAAKTFRPDEAAEYIPAREALQAANLGINRFLRGALRWVLADPAAAVRVITPHLPPLPTKGRAKPTRPSDGRSGNESAADGNGPA
jgi:hypothetical protein